SGDSCLLHS
ncbi:hypothetical protein EC930055_3083, partial [Escherichia coli 93.0055]